MKSSKNNQEEIINININNININNINLDLQKNVLREYLNNLNNLNNINNAPNINYNNYNNIEMLLIYLEQLKKNGLSRKVPNISDVTANIILQLFIQHQSTSILEIGGANGYSTLYWAAYCKYLAPVFNKKNPSNSNARVCSIELSAPMVQEAITHISNQKLHLHTDIYWTDAKKFLNTVKNASFDTVFIDAQKSVTCEFLEKSLPLLQNNALIIIDDVIKFSDKMEDTFLYLKKHQIDYKILQTDADDGILYAHYSK